MRKLKLLISAYACSPIEGSEPGVGWNFVYGLSKHHEVHVISEEKKFRGPIEDFLESRPHLAENLKFYFIKKKRNKKLRKIWPPSYYWYYKDWQKKAFDLAVQLDKTENFDVVHQLTMVGYREPGYLWKMDKPFVWGPIGGLENSPWRFLPSLGVKGFLFYSGRNIVNWWQRNFNRRPKMAVKKVPSSLISATIDNAKLINRLWGKDSYVISEIGSINTISVEYAKRTAENPLIIVWSGLHIPRKNLPLLLKSLRDIDIPYELHILGEGILSTKWRKLTKIYGVDSNCIWHGWLSKVNAMKVMRSGHILCITSISDLTSTVTLEALSNGLPIICLDHCGFASVVTDSCGIKIPVDTPKNASENFKKAIEKLYHDEDYRQDLSLGALERSKEFSWELKIEKLNKIYKDLLNNSSYEKK